MRRTILTSLLAAGLMCAPGGALMAQSVDTGILGTVLDGTGAVIPGVDVTVTNSATGVAQTVVTSPTGTFEIRYLLPGEYVIQAAISGFRTERTTVAIRVGQLA